MSGPQGLKPAFLAAPSGTAEEAAEKVESATSAAKAADGDKGLIAALKRCATQKLIFSAACKAVPYPKPFMRPVLVLRVLASAQPAHASLGVMQKVLQRTLRLQVDGLSHLAKIVEQEMIIHLREVLFRNTCDAAPHQVVVLYQRVD